MPDKSLYHNLGGQKPMLTEQIRVTKEASGGTSDVVYTEVQRRVYIFAKLSN